MDYKYTNEALRKKFKNQFELVSYAISLAENMILTGREPRIKTDLQNRAMQVLAEIAAGKDQFEPVIPEYKKPEDKAEGTAILKNEEENKSSSRTARTKKGSQNSYRLMEL